MLNVRCVCGHSYIDYLGDRPTIVDLGVNRGRFSYDMIKRYGAFVYGAEPDPDFYNSLVQKQHFNVLNVAVSEHCGAAKLLRTQNSCPTLRQELESHPENTIIVPTITFEKFFQNFSIESADLVKMDIEGEEIGVLYSIPDYLLSNIKQMTVEFHGFLNKNDFIDIKNIINYMKNKNFYVFDMSRDKTDVIFLNKKNYKKNIFLPILFIKYTRGIFRILKRLMSVCFIFRSG